MRDEGTGWQEYAEQLRTENDLLRHQLSNERGKITVLTSDLGELRQAAQADQLVIQRLRRMRAADEVVIQQLHRESTHWVEVGNVATAEVEVLTREREEFRAKLARTKQLAGTRAGRVPR